MLVFVMVAANRPLILQTSIPTIKVFVISREYGFLLRISSDL